MSRLRSIFVIQICRSDVHRCLGDQGPECRLNSLGVWRVGSDICSQSRDVADPPVARKLEKSWTKIEQQKLRERDKILQM